MIDRIGLLDLVVIGVLVAAAVAGFSGSGRGRGGRSLGGVVGALVAVDLGSGLLLRLVRLGEGRTVQLVLLFAGFVGLLALGAAAGGALGRVVGTGLARVHLGLFDRLLGAAGSTAVAALILVLLAGRVPGLTDADGSSVLQGLRDALPMAPEALRQAGGAVGLR